LVTFGDVTEHNDETSVDEHSAGLDRALAESQRLEREERDADLARQRESDERIVRALRPE
jgi:hypothetical protein